MVEISKEDESAIRDVPTVERDEILTRIRAMQEDLDAIIAASSDANTVDEHDPEGSIIAYERAHVAALLARAQSNLAILIAHRPGSLRETIRAVNNVLPRSRAIVLSTVDCRLSTVDCRTCFDGANAIWSPVRSRSTFLSKSHYRVQ